MDDVELRKAEEDAREEHDRTLAERDRVGDMTPAGDAALFGGGRSRIPKVAPVAFCGEHGLHGGRSDCFECGHPAEKVTMVEAETVLRVLVLCEPLLPLNGLAFQRLRVLRERIERGR